MNWCDTTLWHCRYAFGLCLSEREFTRQMSRMNVPPESRPRWINKNADATTHFLESDNRRAAIVCIEDHPERNGVATAALLVHEAVHIWQEHRMMTGETAPSSESEAYAVQNISQRLMEEFAKARAR